MTTDLDNLAAAAEQENQAVLAAMAGTDDAGDEPVNQGTTVDEPTTGDGGNEPVNQETTASEPTTGEPATAGPEPARDPVADIVQRVASDKGLQDPTVLAVLKELAAMRVALDQMRSQAGARNLAPGPALVGGKPSLVVLGSTAHGSTGTTVLPAATCRCGLAVAAQPKFHQERLPNPNYNYTFNGTDPARVSGLRSGILGRITAVLDAHNLSGVTISEPELFTILRAHRGEILGNSRQDSTFHFIYYLDARNCGNVDKGGATSILLYAANNGAVDSTGSPLPYVSTNRPVKGTNV